jgi:hypothetical protein
MTARAIAAATVPLLPPPWGSLKTKEEIMTQPNTQKIAELNDLCRTAMGIAGRLVQTSGISALPLEDQSAIREKVELFSDFTPDNDPHKERDFGAFDHNGQKIFGRLTITTPR